MLEGIISQRFGGFLQSSTHLNIHDMQYPQSSRSLAPASDVPLPSGAAARAAKRDQGRRAAGGRETTGEEASLRGRGPNSGPVPSSSCRSKMADSLIIHPIFIKILPISKNCCSLCELYACALPFYYQILQRYVSPTFGSVGHPTTTLSIFNIHWYDYTSQVIIP